MDILKYIIFKTQKVDERTLFPENYGFTPAQMAACANKSDILSALIDAEANINFGTNYGVTPLGIAEHRHNDDASKILK